MNKIILKISFSFLLIIISQNILLAQSDYEKVQKLKSDYSEIERKINNASDIDELSQISVDIDRFSSDYSAHSELFDKALYPEKYQKMMNNLSELIAVRETEFNEEEKLNNEVAELKQRVDTLNVKNDELQASLDEIKLLFEKSRQETAHLNETIARLKNALQKRDALVMNMVDSLMPPVMREKPQLSAEDKEKITSEVDQDNILANVKTTIHDNIKYLQLTSLQPADIEEIQLQQEEFADTWSRIGPKLAEVYSENKNKSNDLAEIDSLFNSWTHAVKQEVWQSMDEDFASNGIDLIDFSNAEEFTNAVNDYIENEKNNIPDIPDQIAENNYVEFAENTWDKEIKPKWVFFLISNGMLDEEKEKTIEQNIDVWKSEIYPSKLWPWIVFPGLILAGLALLFRLRVRKSNYSASQ